STFPNAGAEFSTYLHSSRTKGGRHIRGDTRAAEQAYFQLLRHLHGHFVRLLGNGGRLSVQGIGTPEHRPPRMVEKVLRLRDPLAPIPVPAWRDRAMGRPRCKA